MDSKKRQALEAAGWRFGDAADFLGMTDEERQLLDTGAEATLPEEAKGSQEHSPLLEGS